MPRRRHPCASQPRWVHADRRDISGRLPLACVMGDMDLVRPLGRAGVRCAVVAAADEAMRFTRFQCAVVTREDYWRAGQAQVERLMRFARTQASPPVLYYAGDPELLIVSRHRAVLETAFKFVVPGSELVENLLDKAAFARLATQQRLPVPAAMRLDPSTDDAPVDVSFPVLIKPLTRRDDAWAPVAGAAKALRVESAGQLRAAWRRLAEAGLTVLVQDFVPGPEDRIESYHAYVDAAGEVAGEFTGRKIRTLPTEFGHTTALQTTDAADVRAVGRDVLRQLGLRGLAKADFKRTPDGDLRLLEINPRFSLWHHIGAVAGVNLPALVYADLTGLPRPPLRRARPGAVWSLPWQDLRAARARGVPLRRWAGTTLRADAWSVAAFDDPLPFLRGIVWPRIRGGADGSSTAPGKD